MKLEDATGNWPELGRYYAMASERQEHLVKLGMSIRR